MSGQAFRALASAALQGAGVLNGLAPAEGEPLDDEAMLTRFGGAAASFRRSFDAMPEEERDAAGEGRLLQAFGGLAFSLMRDASPEVSDRVAERLNGRHAGAFRRAPPARGCRTRFPARCRIP